MFIVLYVLLLPAPADTTPRLRRETSILPRVGKLIDIGISEGEIYYTRSS